MSKENKNKNKNSNKERTNLPSNPQKIRAFRPKQKDRSLGISR